MCGISGFIDFTNKSDLSVLKKINNALHYFRRDSKGLKIYNAQIVTIFGNCRLRLIDLLELGSQAME